TEV
ncbi:phosphoribosylformylglycinamidine synthase, partial [Vibrio parahaemolyticus EKP-021]